MLTAAEILAVTVQDAPLMHHHDRTVPTLEALFAKEQLKEGVSPVHYHNRADELLRQAYARREITIDIPPELVQPADASYEGAPAFQPFVLRIEYQLQGSHQGLQFHRTFAQASGFINYFQVLYADTLMPMNRLWMPCIEDDSAKCRWDMEFSISTESIDCLLLEKLHAVSTGVLYRQFSSETQKMFHFKLETPVGAPQIAFAVGLFESMKIPLAPYAYAFCPVGMAEKLQLSVDFFSKSFGFYNWYLSTLFPFGSYFVVFAKQTHCEAYTGANVSVLSSVLLHDAKVIDQVYETRRVLAECLCAQYFGVKVRAPAREDDWLLVGFQRYLSALLLRVFHGKNDYRFTLKTDMERAFELEPGQPPLHSTTIGADARSREWVRLKARLVVFLLERKLEKGGLQRVFMHLWSEACEGRLNDGVLTTRLLLKSVKKMTGKDLRAFADQWIFGSGAPMFTCSFLYNRKKSSIDLDLRQTTPGHPGKKYSGTLLIRVHEQDGIFDHSVHVDDAAHRFELPYHTKIRKQRKKRGTAAEVRDAPNDSDEDMEADEGDQEVKEDAAEDAALTSDSSPIAWIRLDPDMDWLCRVDVHQPDFMWTEQLENDRDVAAQHEAAAQLSRYPGEKAAASLERIVLNTKYFYRVRVDAAMALAGCATEELAWLGMHRLFAIFAKRFGLERGGGRHPLPRPNLFDNLQNYFVQKALPAALAAARSGAGHVPEPVVEFLVDLLRFNDNAFNTASDNYYLAAVIEALAGALAESVVRPELFTLALEELERYGRREQILPSHRNTVMQAVLAARARLAPGSDTRAFEPYLAPGHYLEVRLAAFDAVAVRDPAALERLRGADRRFALGALRCRGLPGAAQASPALKAPLWGLVAQSDDPDWVQAVLVLLSACYAPAEDDQRRETAAGLPPSALPSAAPRAPIRLNMQVHELGSSDEEDAAGAAGEADWLTALAGEQDAPARALPKLKIRPLTDAGHHVTIAHDAEQAQLAGSPMMRVLQEIWDSYDSFPFRYPVDPSVPGYHLVIKLPMDLTTIQERIRDRRYRGLDDLLRDLRLLFDNCFTFNQPGSLIYDQALRLRQFAYRAVKRSFPEQARTAKRQLTASEPIVIIPEELQLPPVASHAAAAGEPAASPLPRLKLSLPSGARPARPAPPPPRPEAERLAAILDRLRAHQHAYWFAQPIDPVALGIPMYLEVVAEPMDFATIAGRLAAQAYAGSPAAFKRDVELVFSNAQLFNPPNTMVHQHAVVLEKLFHRLWSKDFKGIPVQASRAPEAPSAPSSPLRIKLSLRAAPAPLLDWERACLLVLEQTRLLDTAAPFLQPVDPVALGCPTYFSEIRHPMDLATMGSKLTRHLYTGAEAVAEDLRLIVRNCIKFNGKGTGIAKMALDMQSYFTNLMDEHGL